MDTAIQFQSATATSFDPLSVATGSISLWLFLGIAVALLILKPLVTRRSRTRRRGSRKGSTPNYGTARHEAQADALTHVTITAKPLLNRSEAILQGMIRDWMTTRTLPQMDLNAQVSMGEVFGVKTSGEAGRAGYNAFNSKRVDFLLVGADNMPLAGIEYQGGGHYKQDAILRDAVKREVFRKAGIPYVEIKAKSKKSHVFQALDSAFGITETPDTPRPDTAPLPAAPSPA